MPLSRSNGARAVAALAIVLLAACAEQPARPLVADGTPSSVGPARSAESSARAAASVAAVVAPPTAEPVTSPDPTGEPAPAVTEPPRAAPAAPAATAYRIEIPRLGVNLPVAEGDIPRDIEQERTPNNYALHLPGTSWFGAGNTYIYAHARVGMFLNLWNARVGDLVIARTPNGTREFLVAEVHPRVPPTQISWAGPTADTRLTLQTSTGPNSNDPRFVVVARPR